VFGELTEGQGTIGLTLLVVNRYLIGIVDEGIVLAASWPKMALSYCFF
jgi:hypothetical protein